MSADLIWLCVRNTSSFLLKGNGVTFAREPTNLTGKNSFKASGLANAKAVGVAAAEGGVVISTSNAKLVNAPAKAVRALTVKKGSRAANVSAEKILKKYRPDLTPAAKAKVSALLRAQKMAAKGVQPKAKKPRGKKAAASA